MEFITKIIYLGLLLVCAEFFYWKGYKDGLIKGYDDWIKSVVEYDKAKNESNIKK